MEVDAPASGSVLNSQPFLLQEDISSLRALRFPTFLHEALDKLECMVKHGLPPPNKHQLGVCALVDEFIISSNNSANNKNINKKRRNKRGYNKIFSSIQRLHHLEIINNFFSRKNADSTNVTMFMTIFHPGMEEQQSTPIEESDRIDLVCRLVSLAVSVGNASLLTCAAVWMQQLGFSSSVVLRLTNQIIADHLSSSVAPSADKQSTTSLDFLVQVSPLFTVNLITAATQIYCLNAADSSRPPSHVAPPLYHCPPSSFVRQIVSWLDYDITLPFFSLITDIRPLLPPSGLPMPGMSPLPGLFVWAVLHPAVGTTEKEGESGQSGERRLYSQLHSRLIASTVELSSLRQQKRFSAPLQLLSLHQLSRLCSQLVSAGLGAAENSKQTTLSPWQLTCLDRVTQMFKTVLFSGGIHAGFDDCVVQLRRLRSTPLLKIVISQNR